jgi:hypothetical protein
MLVYKKNKKNKDNQELAARVVSVSREERCEVLACFHYYLILYFRVANFLFANF